VAAKLPLLEELAISYCQLSKFALEDVGRSCPLLKSLKFNSRELKYGEFDEEALAIAENMSELRCLQLYGNKLTNDGLQAILDGCPHLESLDLRRCFNVSFAGNLERRCAEQIKDLRLPHDSTDDYEFSAYCSFDDVSAGGFLDIDHFSITYFKNFQIKEQGKGGLDHFSDIYEYIMNSQMAAISPTTTTTSKTSTLNTLKATMTPTAMGSNLIFTSVKE
jgi:hypothetical protein